MINIPQNKNVESIDIENIVALLCLTLIAGMALFMADKQPPVVSTITGGIIGYLTRSYKEGKHHVISK